MSTVRPGSLFRRFLASLPAIVALTAWAGRAAATVPDPGLVEGEFEFRIERGEETLSWWLGGSADAVNTRCESDGVHPPEEAFQPNRFLELANAGREPVRNPRIVVGGRGLFYTLDELLARLVPLEDATPREKALRLWDEANRRSFHVPETWPVGWYHPLLHLASFGFGECSSNAHTFARLLEAAGVPARVLGSSMHTVTEAWWNGAWHLLDIDRGTFYLRADGRDLAGFEDLVRDRSLVRRNHTLGRAAGSDDAERDRAFALFFDASVAPQEPRDTGAPPALTLRTGETLRLEWAPGSHYTDFGFGPGAAGGPPPRLARAALSWRPDVLDTLWLRQAQPRAVRLVREGEPGAGLYPVDPDRTGRVSILTTAPFLAVGGSVRIGGWTDPASRVALRFSLDGRGWTTFAETEASGGWFDFRVDLEPLLDPHGKHAPNSFYLEIVLVPGGVPDGARLTLFELDTELLATADYLPALRAGDNRIEYRDDGGPGTRDVQLRWGWRENWESRPPGAPALTGPAGEEMLRTSRPLFEWAAATDPDGDAIADYEILVSPREDFLEEAAPGLHRYIAATAYAGQTRWRPTAPQLLVAGATYFWKVRARDEGGLWGPWSEARRFQIDLPAPVADLALHRAGESLVLRWGDGEGGRTPATFRIFQSVIQGFEPTGDDIVAEVAAHEFTLRTDEVGSFVRVQPRDADGYDGPVSAPLELPHPFILTEPPVAARAGTPFAYRPGVLQALKYDRFPAADSMRIQAVTLPPWLAPDSDGGGWQAVPGPEHEGVWGMEIAARDAHGGEARQRFAIRVAGEDGGVNAEVPLDAGWTLAAWNVAPLAAPTGALFGALPSPPLAVRVFGEVAPGEGAFPGARAFDGGALPADGVMLVRAAAAGALTVRGAPLDPAAGRVPLVAGWNLVAFPGAAPDSTWHAFDSLAERLVAVIGLDRGPRIYSPAHPDESTLPVVRPGRAYAVRLAEAGTLVFPNDTALSLADAIPGARAAGARVAAAAPDAYAGTLPAAFTPFWGWVRTEVLSQDDGTPWPAGTPVSVLGANGVALARARLGGEGSLPLTAIPGDDPATPGIEGAVGGEALTLVAGGVSFALPGAWDAGDIVEASAAGPLTGGFHPAALAFAAVQPNPASEGALIECALDGDAPASVSLYDVGGRLVRTLGVTVLSPRHGSAAWDGRDAQGRRAAPGVYHARLAQGARAAHAKIVLAR